MDLTLLEGAYCGVAEAPRDSWVTFNPDPFVLIGLLVLCIWQRHSASGLAATGAIAVAFISPICALSAILFSARVVHHVLLIAVAAPLLAMALPTVRPQRILVPFVVAVVVLWIWHIPTAYDAALGNIAIYWVMQATLFASAFVLWRGILHPDQPTSRALCYVFGSYVQMAMLGALLTFAPDQLYAVHATAPYLLGTTPLADQQLGGLIMWIPAGLPAMVFGWVIARRGWRKWGDAA